MISPWVGNRKVAFIVAAVEDPDYEPWPVKWKKQIERRVFHDPDPATGADRSLRSYIATVSSGRARFDADIFGLVSVEPCDTREAIKAVPTSHLYDVACVIFPGGSHPCGGMAILHGRPFRYFDPPRTPNMLRGWCRMRITDSLGVWAMEFLHAATGFDDLYKTDPQPGRFDIMACACGTHPSSFTKTRLGWVVKNGIHTLRPEDDSVTLHAVSLPQPPPDGRVVGLRIPTGLYNRYFLVEARMRTDIYERLTQGISGGIPSEGVVVYEVDETVWSPMKLRTPVALGVGQAYTNEPEGLTVTVARAVAGGFRVQVVSCTVIQQAIELARQRIEALQRELAMGGDKPLLIGQIHQLLEEIATLRQRAALLGCQLPVVAIETYGIDAAHLTLPGGGYSAKHAAPGYEQASTPAETEAGHGSLPHRTRQQIDL